MTSPPPEIPNDFLRDMYLAMLQIRLFEERVAGLVEQGEVRCPCHLYIGQEAVAAGVCAALEARDYVWGGHRSHGHYLAKGGDLEAMMAEICGRATGCASGRGGSMHLLAPEVHVLGTVPVVAATIPIAVGAALATKLRGSGEVSVSFFGDGATDEGHFHESMNLAALHRLPVVFVCENNLYSSHMHISERKPLDNIHRVGELYGVPGLRLDGNDVEAVHCAAIEAVARARGGGGPSLLECRTYRWRGHVGPSWDTDVGVKRRDELKEWLPRDPIQRTRGRLAERGMPEDEFAGIEEAVRAEIEAAVRKAREAPRPDEGELLNHVFSEEGN